MNSLTKKTVQEDISLRNPSSALWKLEKNKPQIRQIYGHFLPPAHRKLVRGLIAKDFNFPPAYHDATNLLGLEELYEIGEKIGLDTVISLSDSIKIRPEEKGAIAYTPYFDGFYMNENAYKILRCCTGKVKVQSIISTLGIDPDTVLEFLARALTLGIVSVYHV